MNPLLAEWTADFEFPPFAEIEDAHFESAFENGFSEARRNIERISGNSELPTFQNTIEALEVSSSVLDRVSGVFFNLASADSNEAREAIQRDVSPKFAALHAETMMNGALFKRVETIEENTANLTDEQKRVLDIYVKQFVRSGARLTGDAQARFKTVMGRLAELGTSFSQAVLSEEKNWSMELGIEDLEGLPDFLKNALAGAAEARGTSGYLLVLSPSLIGPFLQFSPRRDLREVVYTAWKARGANGGETDTRAIIAEMLSLRAERARLLGYPDFASFKLAEEMAKTPENVLELLHAVWKPAKKRAIADAQVLSKMMMDDGVNDGFAPHDWYYYADKRRQLEHNFDEAELKPYLQLDNMIAAAFDCAERLFGLSFREVDLPRYHPDTRAWEVLHGDRHMGVFVGDYFARASKRSGAWCSRFRAQSAMGGEVRPLVVNVCNFAKAADGEPTLLSFEDARTLFHEFGHALHTLMSDVTYPLISGTSVARDFVELPSQLFEHWLSVPQILTKHAKHVETGEPISLEMVGKAVAAENAGQGYATVSYVSSSIVDIAFHTGDAPDDPLRLQAQTLDQLGMPPEIRMRHEAPHFQHVFSGDGYSSGYYSYMWSEVMDADAFASFEETGDPFDPKTAEKLARFIYSAGGSKDPADLYIAFRGKMPSVDALLEKRGFAA